MIWGQERKLGELLKDLGIQLQNEHNVRDLSKNLTSGFVKVESKTFLDEEGNDFQERFGRLVCLNKLVDRLLDLYDEREMPTWHKDTIPNNEVWVKIGADHGRHSLKFTLQIALTHRSQTQNITHY